MFRPSSWPSRAARTFPHTRRDVPNAKLAVEAKRVLIDAKKLGRKIRADLDHGVSESLVIRHLPDTAREQFGREMIVAALRSRRLGAFG